MSEATKRARKSLTAARTDDLDVQIARRHYLEYALDYIEALEGPKFRCVETDAPAMRVFGGIHKVIRDTLVDEICCRPPDLHAEAKRNFEGAVNE